MNFVADIAPPSRPQPDASDFARAKASYAAGGHVEHVVVGAWLLTWGRADFKDFPDWLADQHG